MANFKENPRTEVITFRVTAEEKKKLQELAKKTAHGKVSEMVWLLCKDFIDGK